jgi:branched-chain amino acid transport system substrate-binding protein
MAAFTIDDLGVSRVLVIDDSFEIGRSIADDFERAYEARGGDVVRRALNEGADPATVLGDLAADADAPAAVFFGGFTGSGAPQLRQAMADAGYGDLPFLSWDGVFDGSGAMEDTFIDQAGEAAAGSYLAHSGVPPPRSEFVDRFRAAYGEPPSEYTASAFACAEVILASLREVASTGPVSSELRDALRAHVVDPAHEYDTILGRVGFDANGDSTSQFVTYYRVEPSAAGGEGDWVIQSQRVFAPTP